MANALVKHRGMMDSAGVRIMDSDSDGTVSLQEFQAAHERIFKAMDTDKDGTLTPEQDAAPSLPRRFFFARPL